MILNYSQQYFRNTKFTCSVLDLKQIPTDSKLEIAIAGRSNCGKSSLINAITQQAKLAIVSKQPGRTQALNYFQIRSTQYLVDLPGYGYAKVNKKTKIAWKNLLEQYLLTNPRLIGIILVMDLRHPFTSLDQQMLGFCRYNQMPIHIVLNRSDQVTRSQLNLSLQKVATAINSYAVKHTFQTTSAFNGQGIANLQAKLVEWIASYEFI